VDNLKVPDSMGFTLTTPGLKNFSWTITPAYFNPRVVTRKKSCIRLTPSRYVEEQVLHDHLGSRVGSARFGCVHLNFNISFNVKPFPWCDFTSLGRKPFE
jgi:hypothetical protein